MLNFFKVLDDRLPPTEWRNKQYYPVSLGYIGSYKKKADQTIAINFFAGSNAGRMELITKLQKALIQNRWTQFWKGVFVPATLNFNVVGTIDFVASTVNLGTETLPHPKPESVRFVSPFRGKYKPFLILKSVQNNNCHASTNRQRFISRRRL